MGKTGSFGLMPEAIKGQEHRMALANSIMWVASLSFQMVVVQSLYSLDTDPISTPYLPEGWRLDRPLIFTIAYGIITLVLSVTLWGALPLAPRATPTGSGAKESS